MDKIKTKAIIHFYNRLFKENAESINEIDADIVADLSQLDVKTLYTPLIIDLLKSNFSRYAIAIKTGLSSSVVRSVGKKHKILK
jgi:hypothetical protein